MRWAGATATAGTSLAASVVYAIRQLTTVVNSFADIQDSCVRLQKLVPEDGACFSNNDAYSPYLLCSVLLNVLLGEAHVLLRRVGEARWIVLDTEGDVAVYDLIVEREIIPLGRGAEYPDVAVYGLIVEREVIPLGRGAEYPAEGRSFIGFRTLTEEELAGYRARATQLHTILGGAVDAAAVDPIAAWLFSDPAHPNFSETVPANYLQAPDAHVIRGSAALIHWQPPDGGAPRWTSAERVRPNDVATWQDGKRGGAGRDPRLLPSSVSTGKAGPIQFDQAVEAAGSTKCCTNLHTSTVHTHCQS